MKDKIVLGLQVIAVFCLVVMAFVSCQSFKDTRSVGDAQKAFAQGVMGARQEAYNYLVSMGGSAEAKGYADYVNSLNKGGKR